MITARRTATFLFLSATVLFCASFIYSEEVIKSIKPPHSFPPSSEVAFSKIEAVWDETAATPTVHLTVHASAKINNGNIKKEISVTGLSADITVDGETWKTFKLERDAAAADVWKAAIVLPELMGAAEDQQNPAAGNGMSENPGLSPRGKAAGAPGNAAAEKTNEDNGGLRGLQKGPPVRSLKSETVKTPRYAPGAEAVICFTATDSLGNTTAELYMQTEPQSESDVHFTHVYEAAQVPGNGQKNGIPDIRDVSAAWLRESIYVRLTSQNAFNPRNYNLNSDLYYYIIHFTNSDINPDAEQAGEGIYQYFLLNNIKLWSKNDVLSSEPFMLKLNGPFLSDLSKIMSTPEKDLPGRLKKLKKDISNRKINAALMYYNKIPLKDSGLATQSVGNHAYWKINKAALVKNANKPESFRICLYSAHATQTSPGAIIISDRTPFATFYMRDHVLAAGKPGLRDEFGGSGAKLLKRNNMPFKLPPGAFGE